MNSKVVVVGAGFAGLSAACALAEKGISALVLESRAFPGGRCFSRNPKDKTFPFPFDNGAHVFLGAYRATKRFLARSNTLDALLPLQPFQLVGYEAEGLRRAIQEAPLPSPLHLACGVLSAGAFSMTSKTRLLAALFRMKNRSLNFARPLEAFLAETRQTEEMRRFFWNPLTHAVFNTEPEDVPEGAFQKVAREAFFQTRQDSSILAARVPLSELIHPHAERFLKKNKGAIAFRSPVQKLQSKNGRLRVETTNGRMFYPHAVILAVPPFCAARLLPDHPLAEGWSRFSYRGILSVDLVFDRPIFPEPLVSFPGARFEWAIRRTGIWRNLPEEPFYYTLIAGACPPENMRTPSRLLLPEIQHLLAERLPKGAQAKILSWRIGREPRATFLWTPESHCYRPQAASPIPGVFLAGDWTATHLPATLESACLSGETAAAACLSFLSGKKSFLSADAD